jgi:hypothetical protein
MVEPAIRLVEFTLRSPSPLQDRVAVLLRKALGSDIGPG